MSNDALILHLSTDLKPVRRRSAWREGALLLSLCAVELALVIGLGLMRPDMGQMIGSAYMLWKLGSLALLAAAGCVMAIRSHAPVVGSGKSVRSGMAVMLVLAMVTIVAVPFVGGPESDGGVALTERLSPVHGMMCALSIMITSLPILMGMALLMRRGAPTHYRASALLSGIAAGLSGALIFALCCPVNDPLYVVVWYSAGCVAVACLARWLLPGQMRL